MASKVRSIISIYENYAFNSVENEPAKLSKKRSKSMSSVHPGIRKPQPERQPKSELSLELIQIEQQVQHLSNNLNNYKNYSRENHIYYQNEIFFLLTDIINVETRDDPYVISKKSELIELLKRLNTGLNSRLPSASKKQTEHVYIQSQKTDQSPHVKKAEPKKQVELATVNRPKSEDEDHLVSKRDDKPEEKSEDEADAPAPSVKTLKQLWEKNISENEKLKEKDVQNVKTLPVFSKLNGFSNTKYIPYSERLKTETSLDLYEHSVESKNEFSSLEVDEKEKQEHFSPDSLSSNHSDGNPDDGSGDQSDDDEEGLQNS